MREIQTLANRNSYSSSAAPEPLLGMTYGQIVDAMAEIRGNDIFISDLGAGVSVTFRQFKERVDAVARSLIALGVKKGDRVAMLGMNNADWVLIQFAAPSIGAWFVNLNAAFPEKQLGRMLKHCDPTVVFSQSHFSRSNYFEMLGNIYGAERATDKKSANNDPILVSMEGLDSPDGFQDWSSFIETGASVTAQDLQARKDAVDFDDINMICYTGGTSGILKAALRTHLSCITSPYKAVVALGLDFDSVICTSFLFFHTAGMNAGSTLSMVAGARLVIPSPSFDATATLHALVDEGCTHYSGIPTSIKALLDHSEFDGDKLKLRTATTGAAGCTEELMERARVNMGITLCISYGGTEAGTLSMTVATDTAVKQVTTVGRVAFHSEAKVIDPQTGYIVQRGVKGEVCSRGPSVMRGYFRAPELTASVMDSDNWYHSGDQGLMDDEGYLQIVGRLDDMIIRGGENVQPTEVEDVVRKWPGVIDVQVVGVPDAKFGHEIAAWVVMEGALDEQGLRDHCKADLAFYQVPRWFHAIDAFPMTGVGKPDRMKLGQLAIGKAQAE